MKHIILLLLVFLTGCSDLTEKESEILGSWEWELFDGEFNDSGYIKLESNRNIAYQIVSQNPTETLRESADAGYWRLKDGKLCVAIEWKESLFQDEVIEEKCIWDIVEDASGELTISLIGDFTQQRIVLNRR